MSATKKKPSSIPSATARVAAGKPAAAKPVAKAEKAPVIPAAAQQKKAVAKVSAAPTATAGNVSQTKNKAATIMNQNFEEINTMVKNQINNTVQSMNIIAKNVEEMNKAVFQFYQNAFENNMAACQSLLNCKNVQEAFDIQSNLAKTNIDNMIAEGSKLSQMSIDAANKAFQPLQSNFNQNLQAANNAAKKAA